MTCLSPRMYDISCDSRKIKKQKNKEKGNWGGGIEYEQIMQVTLTKA